MVSIIILLYNSETYLDECLQSAINQTHQDIEIIVVLNGYSKDNTDHIVEQYALQDKRIKVVRNHEDSVISHGLKLGMDNVSGEYFTILEGDDFLALNAIENLLKTMEETNADFVAGNILKITETGKEISRGVRPQIKEMCPVEFFRVAIPYMDFLYHGKLFAKKTYQKDFQLLSAFIGHDVLITYQLALNADKIANCDEIVHFFRRSKKSVSKNVTIKHLEGNFECLLLMNQIFEKKRLYEQDEKLRILFETHILRLLASCLVSGKKQFYTQYKNDIKPLLQGEALKNHDMREYLNGWAGILLILDMYKLNPCIGNICMCFFDVIRKIRKNMVDNK